MELGRYLPHPGIRVSVRDLYRDDGVHLLEKGHGIFLEELWQGLLAVLSCPVGMSA